MPLLTAVTTASLFFALASATTAQQCYYPDGSSSNDTPCSTDGVSSCCGSTSYCMDNGLCFGGGIVSRGSCTDKTWNSDACTGYCKTNSPSGSELLLPCSTGNNSNTFVCGLNATACADPTAVFSLPPGASLVLRSSQKQALLGPSSNATSTDTTGLYTGGALAGLGVGLGLPLLAALVALFILYRRHRGPAPPKLMYRLPDNHDDYRLRPPPPIKLGHSSNFGATALSRADSDAGSFRTVTTVGMDVPPHMQNFMERYQTMSEKGKSSVPAVELPGSMMAHELADRRKSNDWKV